MRYKFRLYLYSKNGEIQSRDIASVYADNEIEACMKMAEYADREGYDDFELIK